MRRSIAMLLMALSILAIAAVPASAAPEGAPGQICKDYEALELPSKGACASTIATGELTRAAYVAQCQWIRENDPESFYRAPNPDYPFDQNAAPGFGGKIGTCASLLEYYHGLFS